MINYSIQKIESKELNSFGQVTKRKLPSDFWLPTQDTVEINKPIEEKPVESAQVQADDTKNVVNSESISSKIKIVTPDEARKTKNLTTIGLSIAGATVLTAATIFIVLKGGTKNLSKNFEKLRDYLERQLLKSKLDNEGEMTLANKVYVYMIKSLDTLARKAEAVNNFTNLKDMAFKKLMSWNKYTDKIQSSITRMFERIGRQSVINQYKSTTGRMKEAHLLRKSISKLVTSGDIYDEVTINGIKKTKAEWLTQIDSIAKEMESLYQENFSAKPLGVRYRKIKRASEELKKAFSSLKVFWSKDFFMKFLSESEIVKEKEAIQKSVHIVRRQLSYSLPDMVQDTNDLIMRMTGLISYKDADRIRQLRMIKTDIRSFATIANQDPALKAKILGDIAKFKDDIVLAMQSKKIDKAVGEDLLANISDLSEVIANYKQGKVEDILQIYKALLPKDEYDKVAKTMKNGVKSLDKSIRLETEEYVSKLRDLVLGSAPTDVLTMLGAVGLLGYQIGKSEDNDERLSITLKYGIPALLGQVGVTLYCNAKLFAGTKSLLMGTISGLILNRVGDFADRKLKEHKQKKLKLAGATIAAEVKPQVAVKNPTNAV